MIIIVITTLLFLYWFFDEIGVVWSILVGLFFGFILSEIACGLFYTDHSNINILSQNNTNIYSLSGVNGVSGSFTFGTGTVESQPVYYFAYKTGDKEYTINKLSGEDIRFKLDNPKQPYIQRINYFDGRKNVDSFGYKYVVTDLVNWNLKTRHIVHLPENAIQQSYSAMPQ